MGLLGPCYGSMAHAKKQRRKESQSLLCCVVFTRGPGGFRGRWLTGGYGTVVVRLLQWFMKSGADRFTAPYARTPPHPPRPLLPRQSPVEKGSQAEIKGIRQ